MGGSALSEEMGSEAEKKPGASAPAGKGETPAAPVKTPAKEK